MFEHGFLPLINLFRHPLPDNNRVCDHNPMLAFPRETISNVHCDIIVIIDMLSFTIGNYLSEALKQ